MREELDESRMTVLEHLQELRKRLRNAGIVLIVAGLGAYHWAMDFFWFLARPVERALVELGQKPAIVQTRPGESFWVQFELALILGLAVALPFIAWELWKFVAPGLYRREKRLALVITGATVVCFLGGAFFGYTLLSKTAHLFLLGSGVQNMLTMEAVADFQITMLLGAGVAFELPVVLSVFGWMGLVSAGGLWRFNRYALVLAVLAGAVLTPGGDVLSQVLLAGPLYALYNLSIVVVWALERGGRRRELSSPLLLLLCAWPAVRRRVVPAAA